MGGDGDGDGGGFDGIKQASEQMQVHDRVNGFVPAWASRWDGDAGWTRRHHHRHNRHDLNTRAGIASLCASLSIPEDS